MPPLVAALFLVVPVFETVRWIRVAKTVTAGQAERVAAYMAPLPDMLQSTGLHTAFLIVLCMGAIIACASGLETRGLPRILVKTLLVISSVLAGWFLFSLM